MRGHGVTLWTPVAPRGCPVPSRPLDVGRLTARFAPLWGGTIRETRPDAVYFRWCVAEGPSLTRAAARLGVPCYAEVNGILGEELPEWNLPARCLAARAERLTAKRATGVVVPTAGVRAHLVSAHGLSPEKVLAAGNGVDPAFFAPLDARDCRMRLGLDPAGRFVGFVGSFQPWHGAELLVEAFAEIARRDPGVRLLMVGDGPSRASAEEAGRRLGCAGRVLWRGHVPRSEVPVWIGALDAAVVLWHPVRGDPGSSVKLLEYMACARAVATSDVTGYAEPVNDARAGRAAPVGDAAALSGAIREILDLTEGERRVMGVRGREYVLAHRTWDHTAREILAFMGNGRPAGSA